MLSAAARRRLSPSRATDARFPVRRIFCVGRNYAAHAREMGRDPDREPPFFFLKPADAVVDNGAAVPYPPRDLEFPSRDRAGRGDRQGGFDIPAGGGARPRVRLWRSAST